MAGVGEEIRTFIVENFLFGQADALPDVNDSLLGAGVIDSTGVLELVLFLEERFQIQVADAEMVPENLDSLTHIAGFVERKRSSRAD